MVNKTKINQLHAKLVANRHAFHPMEVTDAPDLSTCLWNLNTIGTLEEGQRLDCTSEVVVKLDTNSVHAQLCRIVYRDSRHSTVCWLRGVASSLLRLAHLQAVLSSVDTRALLVRSAVRAVSGVRNLMSLYSDDDSVVAQLQHVVHTSFNLSLNILHTTSPSADTFTDFTGDHDKFLQLQSMYGDTPLTPEPLQSTKSEGADKEEDGQDE